MESRDAITIHFDTIDQLVESCYRRRFTRIASAAHKSVVIRVYDDVANVIETQEHAGGISSKM
jgi:hypothetical protein